MFVSQIAANQESRAASRGVNCNTELLTLLHFYCPRGETRQMLAQLMLEICCSGDSGDSSPSPLLFAGHSWQSEAAGPVSCNSSAAASCRCVSKLRVRVLAPDLVVKINQGQWLLLLGSDFNKSGRQGGDEIIQPYLICLWLIILVKQ